MSNIKIKSLLLALILGLTSVTNVSNAVVEVNEFATPEEEARYKELIAELRCPKCQNQNLLDSDAPIAADLRKKTRSLVEQGKSNSEIKTYMLDRYGDFVLYKPRFTLATAFLWIGPFFLLAFVLIGILRRIKRKQDAELLRTSQSDDEAVRVKVRNLMSNAPSLNNDK